MDRTDDIQLETHPWDPFIPDGAKVLIMGTFPPQPKRWAMDFYYPNRTNDFWFMMGLIFFGDRDALYDRTAKRFDLDASKATPPTNFSRLSSRSILPRCCRACPSATPW